jgi:hypothetical protein
LLKNLGEGSSVRRFRKQGGWLPHDIIVQFACIWHKSFFLGDPKIRTPKHFVTNNLESHQAAMLASDDSWNDKTSKKGKQMKNSQLQS